MHLSNPKVLILSGGKSSRYGSPKALIKYKGETFLNTIVSKCLSLDLEVFLVLNTELNTLVDVNEHCKRIIGDSTKDMYDSIIKGINYIKDFSQLIIWPVDHPFVKVESLHRLIENKDAKKVIVPSFIGRLGHPVMLPFSSVAYLNQCQNLRELIEVVGRTIIQVDDKGILYNINSKEDLPNE